MSEFFAISEVKTGHLNALVKNIMRQTGATDANEAVRLVNSGEWLVARPTRLWREEKGVIEFTLLPTEGTTGPQWEKWYDDNSYNLSSDARKVLNSEEFKPTSGVINHVAVLKGELFPDDKRLTRLIRAEAKDRKLPELNAEACCLIRKMFPDEELEAMGLWGIVVFHKGIEISPGDPRLLTSDHSYNGRRLSAYYGRPGDDWDRGFGFAFGAGK